MVITTYNYKINHTPMFRKVLHDNFISSRRVRLIKGNFLTIILALRYGLYWLLTTNYAIKPYCHSGEVDKNSHFQAHVCEFKSGREEGGSLLTLYGPTVHIAMPQALSPALQSR